MRQGSEWAIQKSDVPSAIKRNAKNDYADHERAVTAYNHYVSGFTEEEIVEFFISTGSQCEIADIQRDIQHIKSQTSTRTLIAHENDRNRLLLQRTEGTEYRRLLGEALKLNAAQYLAAGMSPTSPLKEFREAVGMTEKPGAINLSVNQQSLNINGETKTNSGIRSSEDLLRSVMERMKAKQAALPSATDIIDAEAVSIVEEEAANDIPDADQDDEELVPDDD